jgi:hypothetical protein
MNDNPFLGRGKLRLKKFSKCRKVLFVVTCAGQIQKFYIVLLSPERLKRDRFCGHGNGSDARIPKDLVCLNRD